MRYVRWLPVLALVFAGLLNPVRAEEEKDPNDTVPPEGKQWWQKYCSVKEWKGVWETSTYGTYVSPMGGENSRYEARSHGSFLLKRPEEYAVGGTDDPRRGILIWRGEGIATGRGNGMYSKWQISSGVRNGEDWQQQFQGSMRHWQIEFKLWYMRQNGRLSQLAGLHIGNYDQKNMTKGSKTGYALDYNGHGVDHRTITETFQQPLPFWYLGFTKDMWPVVEAGPGVLEFNYEEKGVGAARTQIVEGAVKKNHVLLIPVFDNLEVEVTIEGYDDWRPKGTVSDPKKPGNDLVARATLKNKDGSTAELPPVRRFTFELKNTSREPGICMNWPLNAKDNDLDLRLVGGLMGGELSKEDQKLVVTTVPKDEQGQPYTEAKVDSYDFGGRSELRVTCELQDGREITGLIKNEKGEEDLVRIPKMDGPGWIAEGWLKKKGVTDLADNDDEEQVEGQDYKGDGFTLYEEYRGFVENGVRVEGDPKKKDLFILNLADVATRSGISLFEQLSKVKAHGRLRDGKEMTQEDRVMNGNHRDAPHRVDQHGVVLSHVGMGKAGTQPRRRERMTKRRSGRATRVWSILSPRMQPLVFFPMS